MEGESVNPMELKKRLAGELVTQLYDRKAAGEAEEYFARTVQNKELPDEIPESRYVGDMPISQLLVKAGLTESRSEANRLIKQGAVSVDGEKVTDSRMVIPKGSIVKVGKRRYLKIT